MSNQNKSPFKIAFAQGSQLNICLNIQEFENFQDFGETFSECQKGGKHENYFVRSGDIKLYPEYTTSKGTEYSNIYPRCDAAMESASLLIIDADKSKSGGNAPHLKEISAGLKKLGYTHFGYTSHSQTETVNKCRVAIPCDLPSKDYLIPTIEKLVSELNELDIDVFVNDEMKRWSQPWFVANRDDPTDGLFHYEGFYDGKDFVAVPYHKDKSTKEKSKQKPDTKSIDELGKDYDDGHRHGPSRSMAMSLANHGYKSDDIYAILKRMFPDVSDSHHEQSASSAVNKVNNENQLEEISIPQTRENPQEKVKELLWPPGKMGELAKSAYDYQSVNGQLK